MILDPTISIQDTLLVYIQGNIKGYMELYYPDILTKALGH